MFCKVFWARSAGEKFRFGDQVRGRKIQIWGPGPRAKNWIKLSRRECLKLLRRLLLLLFLLVIALPPPPPRPFSSTKGVLTRIVVRPTGPYK